MLLGLLYKPIKDLNREVGLNRLLDTHTLWSVNDEVARDLRDFKNGRLKFQVSSFV